MNTQEINLQSLEGDQKIYGGGLSALNGICLIKSSQTREDEQINRRDGVLVSQYTNGRDDN